MVNGYLRTQLYRQAMVHAIANFPPATATIPTHITITHLIPSQTKSILSLSLSLSMPVRADIIVR